MPYVSMFFGIIIRMFHNEHNPPHFHAEYQGQRGLFDLNGNMIKGNMKSNTAKKLIKEWAMLHREELLNNWKNATQGEDIDKIEPLN
ncbi:MAG: transcriptional regulator [Candidatus Methylumidiphilus alinenensis]|uniref:Transcriptional regulator n=1 Tax=Candidatus Methylumidiphilus alinenensis TaxID=2202197 RepID=A0A2W4QC25_9GAMM|nr:MAG: transcriptional regulator [Candidatus Methylumidiphilus alinenensis]